MIKNIIKDNMRRVREILFGWHRNTSWFRVNFDRDDAMAMAREIGFLVNSAILSGCGEVFIKCEKSPGVFRFSIKSRILNRRRGMDYGRFYAKGYSIPIGGYNTWEYVAGKIEFAIHEYREFGAHRFWFWFSEGDGLCLTIAVQE